MQTIDRGAFNQVIDQLQETVGIAPARGTVVHTCIQGVLHALDVPEADHQDQEQFCRTVKGAYIKNLFQTSVDAMRELREIASTGKSDGLIRITQLLDESFKQAETEVTPEPEHFGEDHPTGHFHESADYE